ncbi:Sorting nexin mvp1 [Elasticomyces elasticus]|uniref:Sorting nexin MVP1 n=1 Tax=Exophiala sideris TaxID=1016849 RepID=A0ABR0JHW0_9EURO|nr:Sorting nexin mvp1 [Elasticomyces elasticus]KAK5033572.1 Sorting nexin mvp1 [Exophiala sideris]KAK5041933.1 Sorting nexin mvp1 [Exophiala sideris]KAK5064116.1 Sorting nexin mvp1 [Exophiala sideris]KAK5185201.1 Sorting nexin mvp1 [Eurotiomycetes sp. CCFEE 6388]
MSLFGSSPTENAPLNSKTLFGDEPAQPATSSSLFADAGGDSPWSMPTPKRNARQNLVKNLLPATDVPESYVDAYDTVLNATERTGVGIGVAAVKSILQSSNLSEQEQHRILNFVIPGGQESANGVGRSEFNVLLALIGLGQEGEDITLDGVDERRRKLPEPKVGYIDQLRSNARPQPIPATAAKPTPARPQQPRNESFGTDPTSDPWASPSNNRLPPPSTAAHTMPTNGLSEANLKSAPNGVERTTSAFTTRGDQESTGTGSPNDTISGGAAGGWNSYNGSAAGFSEQPTLGGGFGDAGDDQQPGQSAPNNQNSIGRSIVLPSGTGEQVMVSMLPDKEGVFLFQHRNYEVKTIRRGSSVVRRYSDFVWLLDCLQKRYPFRRLPLLPPKRVQVNGTHLSADANVFLEKRRRGLVRFTNALVQHPVLSQETLVVMFLTVPTELSVWRKQATISVQEEFTGKALPPALEDSLPANLHDLFETVRAGVRRSAELYINLCIISERLVKRNEGLAAENAKFSSTLMHLTEGSNDTYAIDTNDVPLLNEGITASAKHLSTHQTLLDDETQAWDMGFLEDLKAVRDSFVSMRDVFDRRDRYARDNIPQLERRIENSEHKLQQLRQKPPGQVKAGEMEKVESSIMSDKESIVQQHARGVFIKECVRDEIVTFQTSIYATSRMHQDWSQERVKYTELQASNWRSLVDQLESMPLGE